MSETLTIPTGIRISGMIQFPCVHSMNRHLEPCGAMVSKEVSFKTIEEALAEIDDECHFRCSAHAKEFEGMVSLDAKTHAEIKAQREDDHEASI